MSPLNLPPGQNVHERELQLSRSGIAWKPSDWKPGPSMAQIAPRDPHTHGSVPPFHFYDVHELPHHKPCVIAWTLRRVG